MILAQHLGHLPGRFCHQIDEPPVTFVLTGIGQPLGADRHQAEAGGTP